MKALTLTQPWAQLMADEWKHVETRSWRTYYRGLLAIHAAVGFPGYAKDFASTERALGRCPPRIARGAILAVVKLVDVRPTIEARMDASALERYLGDYSSGRWAWFTEFVCKLDEPIPCKGALGLWTVPSDVEALLLAAIGEKGVNVVARPIRVLSLDSGGGGHDLGIKLAIPEARTVVYVEREVTAAAVLAKGIEAGLLDDAPIWTDHGTFDPRPWRGRVDCIATLMGWPSGLTDYESSETESSPWFARMRSLLSRLGWE